MINEDIQYYYYQQQEPQKHKQQQQKNHNYNSLHDPHLELYFRRPAVRRQLLANNIISRDNQIVEEMQSTTYKQAVTLAEKRQVYETIRANQVKQRIHRKSILDRVDALLLLDNEHKSRNIDERKSHEITLPITTSTEPEATAVRTKVNAITPRAAESSPPVNRLCNMFRHQSAPNLVLSCERSLRPKSSYGQRVSMNHKHTRPITSTVTSMICSPPVSSTPPSDRKEIFSIFNNHKSTNRATIISKRAANKQNLSKSLQFNPSISSSLSSSSWIVSKTCGNTKALMTMKYQSRLKVTSLRRVTIGQQRMVDGTTVNIFDQYVNPGDEFKFTLREHTLGSFTLVFMLDQIRDGRLNACCEYKHRSGARFGNFILVSISGGNACLLCEERMHSRLIRFNLESTTRILMSSHQASTSPKSSSVTTSSSSSLVLPVRSKNLTEQNTTVASNTDDFEVKLNDIKHHIGGMEHVKEEEYKHFMSKINCKEDKDNDAIDCLKQNVSSIQQYQTDDDMLASTNEHFHKSNHQEKNYDNHLVNRSNIDISISSSSSTVEQIINQSCKTMTELSIKDNKGHEQLNSAIKTIFANEQKQPPSYPVHNYSQSDIDMNKINRNDSKKIQLNNSAINNDHDQGDDDAQLYKHYLSPESANDHECNVDSFDNESLPSIMLEMSTSSDTSK